MKILLISPLPPPVGGIATWTKLYMNWLIDNGYQTSIVNTAVTGNRLQNINNKTNLLDEFKRTIEIIKNLKIKLKKIKPSVVHLNTSCGKAGLIRDYICALMVKKTDATLIIHYRCNIKDQVQDSIISNYFLKKISNIADKNIVLNEYSKKYLIDKTSNKIFVVPNFIESTFIINHKKYIKETITDISFVGHFKKSKGAIEIINVATKRPDITFKIAGPVSEEIAKMTTPNNLIYLGSINKREVKNLLLDSDIFLFPTFTEGFSNALLESMALGLPIITTSVGANLDMIESKGGLIVNIGDSEKILEAIKIMENPDRRLEMSKWNINKVVDNYEMQKVVDKIIYIYNN